MSRFLTNLASLALGEQQSGVARLSLPPRFGGGVAADAGFEIVEQFRRAAPTAEAALAPAPAPVMRPMEKDIPRNPHPAAAQPANEPAAKRQRAEKVEPVSPRIERRAVETPKIPPPTIAAQPTAMPQRQPVALDPWPIPPDSARVAQAEGTLVVDRPSPTRSAPLRQAVVASRMTVEREPRPVVNVTIDRIEVRAPRDTPPQPPQRRAKAQSSVSLADYLAGRS